MTVYHPFWAEALKGQEYYDAQYNRLRKMLNNKDAQQHKAWEEEWLKRRQHEKEDRETQV